MELIKENRILQQVIDKAWESEAFKAELISNPVNTIEKLTGEKLNLEGKELLVRDQTDESTIFINIPAGQEVNSELTEEQLEAIAGGCHDNPNMTVNYQGGASIGSASPILKIK